MGVWEGAMLQQLICPVCRSEVSTRSAACGSCHLPIGDVSKHQTKQRSRRSRALTTRAWGAVIYGGIVAWCLLQLPSAAVFVLPAAAVAVVLHTIRAKPAIAAVAFIGIVVIAPALFWPSMLSGIVNDLGTSFQDR